MVRIRELPVSVTPAFGRFRKPIPRRRAPQFVCQVVPLFVFVIVVLVFRSSQRESSAARAHDTIGAGRLKRLLGVRFRRRVFRIFRPGPPTRVCPVGGASVSFVAASASGGSRAMRAHSSTRPLDLTPHHWSLHPAFAVRGSCFLPSIPPNVRAHPPALTIPAARVG